MDKLKKDSSNIFIVDNSSELWKVKDYLYDWCDLSTSFDIATGYFDISALLKLDSKWQMLEKIRILMGDEVSKKTHTVFVKALNQIAEKLDNSIENEKENNDFLRGVPAIVQALKDKKIECRVYRKRKFHAKAYITHAKFAVVGSAALVGSSNFTGSGLTDNIELNIQEKSRVSELQDWFEEHWNLSEDVTPDILKVIEKHTREYTPFEVYLKALNDYFRSHEISLDEWENNHSAIYRILAPYQREGYHSMIQIANKYNGALLCDGVGLGKTFIGLMILERLLVHERKRIVLLVPKATRKPVWEAKLKKYLNISQDSLLFPFRIYNHTDLLREPNEDNDWPAFIEDIRKNADVVIIDEAHNFRNQASGRYRKLISILKGNKQVYLLTATPINNSLFDLKHQIDLITNQDDSYFNQAPLSITSLRTHFNRMEDSIQEVIIDSSKANEALLNDNLFRELVVQRSRAYVKKSTELLEGNDVFFPVRMPPQVVPYSLKKVYGRLLDMIKRAFNRKKPLFSLSVYSLYDEPYYLGDLKDVDAMKIGRNIQVVALIRMLFLKRFESSVVAFKNSCEVLLFKLLQFVETHRPKKADMWKAQHEELIYSILQQYQKSTNDDDEDDSGIPDELEFEWQKLDESEFNVSEIVSDTIMDLDQLSEFIKEVSNISSEEDDKLEQLISMLKSDTDLQSNKVIIFTEYKSTAVYLKKKLITAGLTHIEEIDSSYKGDRTELIKRFSPYYNDSSSQQLKESGKQEIRILISTDVLSEGLNLQDASLLINYDLHWNPVRLMQRIGRVDRRLDKNTEDNIISNHPELAPLRGKVRFWNFLPPTELEELLLLYEKVAHKTLRISKTFGIEGRQLLTPEDDFEALREFNHAYEGTTTPSEEMLLKFNKLMKDNPETAALLPSFPLRIFSGKEYPGKKSKGVFFCYKLPVQERLSGNWHIDEGLTAWYFFDFNSKNIISDATAIDPIIECVPDTPRTTKEPQESLVDARKKVEAHIHNSYMRKANVPAATPEGVMIKPILIGWLEINN